MHPPQQARSRARRRRPCRAARRRARRTGSARRGTAARRRARRRAHTAAAQAARAVRMRAAPANDVEACALGKLSRVGVLVSGPSPASPGRPPAHGQLDRRVQRIRRRHRHRRPSPALAPRRVDRPPGQADRQPHRRVLAQPRERGDRPLALGRMSPGAGGAQNALVNGHGYAPKPTRRSELSDLT